MKKVEVYAIEQEDTFLIDFHSYTLYLLQPQYSYTLFTL